MTATIAEVREAMAADLTQGCDLRCSPYLQDQANPPIGMLDVEGPDRVTFSDAGACTYQFVLLYIDQRTSERGAQQRCDELRDPFHSRSLRAALENGTQLAALPGVDYGTVGHPTPLTPVRIGTIDYLACEFPIEVTIHQEDQ